MLWEERERTPSEILAAVETAETSLANGEGSDITVESMKQLADEVKQRGLACRRAIISSLIAHKVAPQAETELDGIWCYVAKEGGSTEIATGSLIPSLSVFFFFLHGTRALRQPVHRSAIEVAKSPQRAERSLTSQDHFGKEFEFWRPRY